MPIDKQNTIKNGHFPTRFKLWKNTLKCTQSVPSEKAAFQGKQICLGTVQKLPSTIYVSDVSSRRDTAILFHRAENLIQAAAFAATQGVPLNCFLTCKHGDKNGRIHSQLLRKIGEWQGYHIGRTAYVWAREATGGPHSHILLHIPAEKRALFQRRARRWVKELLSVKRMPIGTLQVRSLRSELNYDIQLRNTVRYILKGSDEATRRFIDCKRPQEGVVTGKRVGVSASLGVAERRKAGSVLPSGARRITAEMSQATAASERAEQRRRERYGADPVAAHILALQVG